MDRAQLADFLRKRREALQPKDVGLPRGPRRRTAGLRREEVAALCGMSVDYYSRLEQQRGPQPSEQMTAAIARGLRLLHAEELIVIAEVDGDWGFALRLLDDLVILERNNVSENCGGSEVS